MARAKRKTKEDEGQVPGAIIHLLPEQIEDEPATNVRPFSKLHGLPSEDGKDHQDLIYELAESMEHQGQIAPIVVQERGGKYYIVAGRNRVEAAHYINAARKAGDYFRLEAKVLPETAQEGELFLVAWAENQDRRAMSPMDRALVIRRIRAEVLGEPVGDEDWTPDPANTPKIAERLHMSKASVIQAEKLLTLPEELQVRLHHGKLDAAGAFAALDIAEERRAEIVEEAEERDRLEREEAQQKRAAGESTGDTKRRTRTQESVKASTIRKVAEEQGALDKVRRRSVREVLDYIEKWTGPGVGMRGTPFREFTEGLLKFVEGQIGETAMDRRVGLMIEQIPDELKLVEYCGACGELVEEGCAADCPDPVGKGKAAGKSEKAKGKKAGAKAKGSRAKAATKAKATVAASSQQQADA